MSDLLVQIGRERLSGGMATFPDDPLLIPPSDFDDIVNMICDEQGVPTKMPGRSKFDSTELGTDKSCNGLFVHIRNDSTVYIYLAVNDLLYYSTGGAFAAVKFQNANANVAVTTSTIVNLFEFVSHNNYAYVVAPYFPLATNSLSAGNTDNVEISRALQLDGQWAKLIYYDSAGNLTAGLDEVEVGSGATQDPWPRSTKFLIKHKDRAVGFNYVGTDVVAHPSGWVCSEPGTLVNWTHAVLGAGTNGSENTVQDAFTGAIDYGGIILAFSRSSIIRITTIGDVPDWSEEVYERTHGCVSHRSLVIMPDGYVWFVSWDGVYRTNGYIVQKMSEDIDDVFRVLAQLGFGSSITRTTQAQWQAGTFPAGGVEGIDVSTTESAGDLHLGVGTPTWDFTTDMGSLPSSDGWTYISAADESTAFSVTGGILTMANIVSTARYQRSVTLGTAGFHMRVRAKHNGPLSNIFLFGIESTNARFILNSTSVGVGATFYSMTTSTYHVYDFIYKSGSGYLFVDGVLRLSVTGLGDYSGAQNFQIANSSGATANVDYFYMDADLASFATPANWVFPEIDLTATPTSWGVFTINYAANGQVVTFEIETSATSGVYTGTYTAVTSGGIPSNALRRYVKVRIRRTTIDGTTAPTNHIVINDFTINYTTGSSNQPMPATNYKGRYMVSASSALSTTNDFAWIYGKNGKWVKSDIIKANSFAVYNNSLISANPTKGLVYYELTGTQNDGADFTGYFVKVFAPPGVDQDTILDKFYVYAKSEQSWTFKHATRKSGSDWGSYTSETIAASSYGLGKTKVVVPAGSQDGMFFRIRVEVASADANFLFAETNVYGTQTGPR